MKRALALLAAGVAFAAPALFAAPASADPPTSFRLTFTCDKSVNSATITVTLQGGTAPPATLNCGTVTTAGRTDKATLDPTIAVTEMFISGFTADSNPCPVGLVPIAKLACNDSNGTVLATLTVH